METVPGVTTTITIPKDGNSYPTLTVLRDKAHFGLTVAQCDQHLREGEPGIEVLTGANPSLVPVVREGDDPQRKQEAHRNQLQIVSMTLRAGEDLTVGNRLRQILATARKEKEKKEGLVTISLVTISPQQYGRAWVQARVESVWNYGTV